MSDLDQRPDLEGADVPQGLEPEASGDLEDAQELTVEEAPSVSLFEGDEGGLEFAQRRTLVALLKQRFISARTHAEEWKVLVEDERLLRSRLNDLFLDLQIDRSREVAWKRQASSETGGRFPTLLHDVPWSREETLVLVHLRDRLRAGQASGDSRVFVDREDIVDHVASFRPTHATDESGDEKRARNAVATIVKSGLLIGSVGDDRYEVSEAVEPLLPLELLQELLEALRRANTVTERPESRPLVDLFGDEAQEPADPIPGDDPTDDEQEWA